jgi:hypothetical protein
VTPTAIPLGLTVQAPSAQATTATIPLSGTTSGGQGTVVVTWSTDRGASGTAQGSTSWTIAAVALAEGANTITVTAIDQLSNTSSESAVVTRTDPLPPPSLTPPPAVPQAPVIVIASPLNGTLSTTSMTADIQGTATSPAGIKSITWQTSTGGSGVAVGTTSWDTGLLSLVTGAQITVVTNPANPPSGGDTTPPTLTITAPSTTSVYTSDATITITGTASDNAGVTSVRWDTAISGAVANGTSNWSTGPIPLLVGMNNIVIHAFDAAGNSSWRTVSVTKQ